MVNKLLQLFGSYDFVGKAIPGSVLLLGAWSLLPSKVLQISAPEGGVRLVNLLSLLVILLSLGLMIGQAIHTISDDFEKIFRWILARIVDIGDVLSVYGIDLSANRLKRREVDREVIGLQSFPYEWYTASIGWFRARFWGAFDSFASHRYLFSMWFLWNYNKEGDKSYGRRWEPRDKDILMEPFCQTYSKVFGRNFRQHKPEEIESVYPLITAYASSNDNDEFRQFQAIYSFCRSMWAVLFLLTIVYSLAIYQPFGDLGVINSSPKISILPEYLRYLFPIFTAALVAIFMDASGTYKKHFVEYVISSFAISNFEQEQQSTQKTLSQYYQ